jgi:hypothetical protein
VLHSVAQSVRALHHPVEPVAEPVYPVRCVLFGPARFVARPGGAPGCLIRQSLRLIG